MSDYQTALAIVRRVEGGVAMHREMTHAEAMALIRSWVELHDTLLTLQEQITQAGAASMSLGEPRKD